MATLTYLFSDPAKTTERRRQYAGLKLPKTYDVSESIFEAIAKVLRHPKPNKCTIVGDPTDIQYPDSGGDVPDSCWLDGLLTILSEQGVKFIPLSGGEVKVSGQVSMEVLGYYRKVFDRLTEEVTKHQHILDIQYSGKVPPKSGRPPYGYAKNGKRLEAVPHQAAAVKFLFQMFRDHPTTTWLEAVNKMQEHFPELPNGKSQYWDVVKVRRIMHRANLYCLGEYEVGEGKTALIKSLSILPPEWVDTLTKAGEMKREQNKSAPPQPTQGEN